MELPITAAPQHRKSENGDDQASQARLDAIIFGMVAPFLLLVLAPAPFRPAAVGILVVFPLALGLKHGLKAGLCGAIMAAVVMAIAFALNPEGLAQYPKVTALACLLAGLLAGFARDRQENKLRELNSSFDLQRVQLQKQREEHRNLQVAHADLQCKLASQFSLRTCLEQFRLSEHDSGCGVPDGQRPGARILNVFRNVAPLKSAALFLRDDTGNPASEAAAVIGGASRHLTSYPHLREAPTAATWQSELHHPSPGSPVATVVLRDSQGLAQGALVIDDMAYEAIRPEVFTQLCILGRHAAHSLARRHRRPPVPFQDVDVVRAQLATAVQEARNTAMSLSVLVSMPAQESTVYLDPHAFHRACAGIGRILDHTWSGHGPRGPVNIKFLPMTNEEGVVGFTRRFQRHLAEQFPAVPIAFRAWTFRPDGRDDPMQAVDTLLSSLTGRPALQQQENL